MQHRTLGRTQFEVSALGWGAAPAAYLATDAADVAHALLDSGVNLVDTAVSYPGSHQFIGEHLAARRGEFVLVSKVHAGPKKDWSPETVKQQVDDALRDLRTDVIDVMLLHTCPIEVLEQDDALGALVDCREAGKIRFAGFSGDNDAAAFACKLPDVAVLETSLNVVDQKNVDDVLPVALAHDVGVIAKRPVANAAWKDLATQQGIYKNYAKAYTDRWAKMKLDPAELGATAADWPELALRFTLALEGVATAIVGTRSAENARANVAFAEKGPLEAAKVKLLRDKFHAAPGSAGWAGQT